MWILHGFPSCIRERVLISGASNSSYSWRPTAAAPGGIAGARRPVTSAVLAIRTTFDRIAAAGMTAGVCPRR